MTLAALPGSFATTRQALHAVAEHVLAPARCALDGRVGLRPTAEGIGTPPAGSDGRAFAIEGDELVVTDRGGERRAALTTVGAAARFVGVEPGVPLGLWSPDTDPGLEAELHVDAVAAVALADWFRLGERVLSQWAAELATRGVTATEQCLWPEHFDLALTADDVNYGFSPGDAYLDEPYVYVGPHQPPAVGGFWNAPFGAAVGRSRLDDEGAALDVLRRGEALHRV